MLTLKTKCLIAYCHTLLTEAEELTEQGKGECIVKDDNSQQFMRECGASIINFCESTGSTKKDLSDLSKSRSPLFIQAKSYYGLQIRDYQIFISEVGGRHIPILYAGLMFQTLKTAGVIGLDMDYGKLISDIEVSDVLETTQKKSRFNDKMITERTEVRKYRTGVESIISNVMNLKIKFSRSKNKRKK